MNVPGESPARITLDDWTRRHPRLLSAGMCEPSYGGPLIRHFEDGDSRLAKLKFDNSPAALRLWNLVLPASPWVKLEAKGLAEASAGPALSPIGHLDLSLWSLRQDESRRYSS